MRKSVAYKLILDGLSCIERKLEGNNEQKMIMDEVFLDENLADQYFKQKNMTSKILLRHGSISGDGV